MNTNGNNVNNSNNAIRPALFPRVRRKSHVHDPDVLLLLFRIIDSYEKSPGKGLPLGNQASQWFAVYYLDGFDRFIKSELRIRYYSRYMDDCILIHPDRRYLSECRKALDEFLKEELGLCFNEKTQICPIRKGVQYLGFHFYLSESGKVIRKIKQTTKYKYKRKIRSMMKAFADGSMEIKEINQILDSYQAHLVYGHTWHLRKIVLESIILTRHREEVINE